MRILSVTQTYAPFLEFGGPPVKVRALARGLARRGHDVTVLTADWGVRTRMGAAKRSGATEAFGGEQTPFGWSCVDSGVTSNLSADVAAIPLGELESSGEKLLRGTAAKF